jgi:hypothetical protein
MSAGGAGWCCSGVGRVAARRPAHVQSPPLSACETAPTDRIGWEESPPSACDFVLYPEWRIGSILLPYGPRPTRANPSRGGDAKPRGSEELAGLPKQVRRLSLRPVDWGKE